MVSGTTAIPGAAAGTATNSVALMAASHTARSAPDRSVATDGTARLAPLPVAAAARTAVARPLPYPARAPTYPAPPPDTDCSPAAGTAVPAGCASATPT